MADFAQRTVEPQVSGIQSPVRLVAKGPQDDTATCVVAHGAHDVRVGEDEIADGLHLGLGKGVVTRSRLPYRKGPVGRVLPVEIQPVLARDGVQGYIGVVVPHKAFDVEVVVDFVRRTQVVRTPADHDSRVLLGDLPPAVGVLHPHLQYPTVAVYVFGIEPRLVVSLFRPGPEARPEHVGGREIVLGAVHSNPRDEVEDPGINEVCDAGVFSVTLEEHLDGVEDDLRARHLSGMSVGICVDAGFVRARTRLPIGDLDHEDLPVLVGLADTFYPAKLGILTDAVLQERPYLIVCMVLVEAYVQTHSLPATAPNSKTTIRLELFQDESSGICARPLRRNGDVDAGTLLGLNNPLEFLAVVTGACSHPPSSASGPP